VSEFHAVHGGSATGAPEMSTTFIRTCRKCGAKLFGEARVCTACLLETALRTIVDGDVDLAGNDRMKSPSPMRDFGDYELLEEIGRGGQGVVYRARQKSLNRIVALKVIGLGNFASAPHLKRFRHEAEAAAKLEHPQIVPIYEIGERDGSCYFSMKFVEGGQLDALVKGEPTSIRRAAELLVKISRTVQFAHEHGILHRDIKPGNVLLDRQGEPHLTDFGLARLIEDQSTITNSFDVLGTPSYMAPEQAAGRTKDLKPTADVYGLGAVFYQMLTGEPPFAGGTTYETIRLVLETEPRNPRVRNPKVDADLATICLKCLEKDPSKRYPAAARLAEDLEHWLRYEPITARPANVFTRARKWIRRNPARAALIPSLIGLAALAVVLVSTRETPPPSSGIAVLPFENLGDVKENAAFADGIQDDILTKLAKVADLKVISRTSVMQYRGEQNTRKIGQALRVSHVLEGSVRRMGEKIHLNAQLIDARTDQHIWADQYDEDVNNSLGLPAEIAQQVADQLRARVSRQEKTAIHEPPTNDFQAYELYNQARMLRIYNDPADWEKSLNRRIELLEQATQRDPNFALAYCELARAQGRFEFDKQSHLPLAKQAIDAAIRIRPDLGEVHRELGRYYYYTADYEHASQELAIARRKLPNDAEVMRVAGDIACGRGRWDEALSNFEKAHDLDPRNGEITNFVFETYQAMRRYDEEARFLEKAATQDPEYPNYFPLMWSALRLDSGDLVGAKSALAQPTKDPPEDFWFRRFVAAFYSRDYDEASKALASAPKSEDFSISFGGTPPESWFDGLIAQLRGDQDKAKAIFLAARKAFDENWGNRLKTEHYFSQIARIDASLGRKEDAIREARQAVELMPIKKNAAFGPAHVRTLAMVYMIVGERDLAIKELQTLAKIPSNVSYGDLHLNPIWDPLRGDPRFEKIVGDLKPKAAK
jgi:serine/threonine protein kinase/tetratricopeptide (TPR) repeat protein